MTRGAIYWVNLEDTRPPEFGKTRPALVLSNSEQNAILDTVVVVPISTRPPHLWPLRLELPRLAKLRKSYAIVPGIQQVAKSRLGEPVGSVPESFLDAVRDALQAYLGD